MNYIEPNDLTCNMFGHFELTTDNEKSLRNLSNIVCIISRYVRPPYILLIVLSLKITKQI
jgi:hypothetical protein